MLKLSIYILIGFIIGLAIWNILQKKHSLLRTYPLVGYIRYFAETLGIYLRQYFYARDREELPFNRDQRRWV